MLQAFKRIYNFKLIMFWIICFPGIMAIINNETLFQYAKMVVFSLLFLTIIHTVFNNFIAKSN